MTLGCGKPAPVKPPAEEMPPPAAKIIVEEAAYVPDAKDARGKLYRPDASAKLPGIVLVHSAYGLGDFEKRQAERLAGLGYAMLAVDLYRGETADNVEDAHILERGLPENRAFADLKAAVDYLQKQPGVSKEAIGLLGFDMGGGYALEAATRDPRLRACVVCYGKLITDPVRLEKMQASVLGIFAGKDAGTSPETIAAFRAAMKKADKRLVELKVYEPCEIGFLDKMADAPFDEARTEAWSKIDSFLAAELGRGTP